MARRTRKRNSNPSPPASPDAEPESLPDTHLDSELVSLFDTTFSLHRVSPLFIGSEPLTSSRLQVLANRLRDVLVGDVIRGVEVGLEGNDTAMGHAGALELVTMEWISMGNMLDTTEKTLLMSLQYENAVSTGLLLPQQQTDSVSGQFTHLPLLLLRMPVPLRAVVIDFFSRTFDCHIGPLRLGTPDLANSWEGWIRDAGLTTKGPLAKDAVLTLGFRLPHAATTQANDETETNGNDELGIRSMDIIIPNQDLRKFVRVGQAKGKSDERAQQPFIDAVAEYMKYHLALDMSHTAVRITRIACGGFVLSEGRIKIFGPPEDAADDSQHSSAVRNLLGNLVTRAKGTLST